MQNQLMTQATFQVLVAEQVFRAGKIKRETEAPYDPMVLHQIRHRNLRQAARSRIQVDRRTAIGKLLIGSTQIIKAQLSSSRIDGIFHLIQTLPGRNPLHFFLRAVNRHGLFQPCPGRFIRHTPQACRIGTCPHHPMIVPSLQQRCRHLLQRLRSRIGQLPQTRPFQQPDIVLCQRSIVFGFRIPQLGQGLRQALFGQLLSGQARVSSQHLRHTVLICNPGTSFLLLRP